MQTVIKADFSPNEMTASKKQMCLQSQAKFLKVIRAIGMMMLDEGECSEGQS